MRQGLAIVGLCTAAAVGYGLLHDQVTVRLSLEYFTVLHPHVVDTDSPTVLALVWGVIASWWVGVSLGVPLAACCRSGPGTKLAARDVVRPVLVVLAVMGAGATLAGAAGWWLAASGRMPANYPDVPAGHQVGTMAAAFAHVAAESLGVVGGLCLCIWALVRRMLLDAASARRR